MNKKEFLGASLHTGLKSKNVNGETILNVLGFDVFGDVTTQLGKTPIQFISIILRPLSDLTKPITHNGETFVPIAKLFKMPDSEVDIIFASEECVQFINKRTRCHYYFYVDIMRLTEALKLIEWHFAIGLKDDEYIDVNSLSDNPYK